MPVLPKHILVIRLSALGDVAMIVPVLSALTSQYPSLKITVLTRSFFSPLFRGLNNVRVYPAEVNGTHKGLLGLTKLSKELKKLNIDAIADLHNVLRSKILKALLNKKLFIQLDKGRASKRDLVKGSMFEQLKSTHQRYADVFEKMGFNIDLTNPSFPRTPKLSIDKDGIKANSSIKWIGIAPFAQYTSKMYPLDLMEEVIQSLSQDYMVFLFGGGKEEEEVLNKFESKYDQVTSLAGRFSLDKELDYIGNLDAMLSMDSGNAHMAAMMGKKVITLWGATHPFAGFYPFNQNKDWALLADRNLYPKIPTSIYGNKFPEEYKDAMRTISPKSIVEKIKNLI